MTPVYSVLTAMFCYAVANVLIEQKLTKYHNFTLMIFWGGTILILAIIGREWFKTAEGKFDFPTGSNLGWILLVSVSFFLADYFYLNSYTKGGNLYTIVTVTLMFPVFASLMKLAWTGTLPNLWQLGGYATAALAVLLITRGNVS